MRYCKFAQADTKGARAGAGEYLEKKLKLDQPINIHLTGCPHSCAQHYMGDIGLLGTKVKIAGESWKATMSSSAAASESIRPWAARSSPACRSSELPAPWRRCCAVTCGTGKEESFPAFTARHDLDTLQAIFSNEE